MTWMLSLLLLPAALGAETIPAVHATSLAGEAVSLPADLHGRTAVLVIGFSHDSQTAVRDWGVRLAKDYGGSATVTYYEMAMLGAAPRLVRGLIVRSMKKEVEAGAQTHFLTVTDEDGPWRKVARYSRAETAYVVVVDGAGTVLWQTAGDAGDAAYAELRQRLR